ncbi:MAG: AAA family ATPase [Deltaproteobacteria bacterium]|nr:AAA family ATPase [Candidatus Anaeroferrophillus wilburensis]MBN2890145.1 AAA family ATPase [Deltaproteobacteria bacterium]
MGHEAVLPPMITDLLRPDRYDPVPENIELLQTHISWVIIADQLVYKIKKPVDFGFIDYSSLEQRHHFCQEELRLNRRLSRDVYLRVEPIVKRENGFFYGGSEQPVEYAVVMQRLPEDRMMKQLLARGELRPEHLQQLAEMLAAFYRQARVIGDGTFGTLETVSFNIRENFEQTEKYLGKSLTEADYRRIIDFNEQFFREHEDLFGRRVEQGMVKECHGDLHMEHICFAGDHIDIYDCIEFNDRFRLIDVMADVAFLAMDLDYHNRHDLAALFLKEFGRCFGDEEGLKLLPLYKCYRAYVRGKVISFLLDDPSLSAAEKESAANRARRYFQLAAVYTYQLPPSLILVTGISGSGKSYLAAGLAAVSGFSLLRSDQVRKELKGVAPGDHRPAGFEAGLYDPAVTRETYESLVRLAGENLPATGVIVDATCLQHWQRQLFYDLAAERQVPVSVVSCDVPWEVVTSRLEQRSGDAENISDADLAIARRQLDKRELPDNGEKGRGRWLDHDATADLLAQLYALVPRLA